MSSSLPIGLLHSGFGHRGITGSVRDEHTVELLVAVLKIVIVRNDMKLDIEFQQVSDDVVLDTTIVRNDLGGLALVEHANALGGYLLNQIQLVGILERDLFLLGKLNLTQNHTGLTNDLGKLSRVDSVKCRNVELLAPITQRALGIPVIVSRDNPSR